MFAKRFINSKNTGAQMLACIYQGHQTFLKMHFWSENVNILPYLRIAIMDVVT